VAEIGIFELSKKQVLKGAVFCCELASLLPFEATDEIKAIKLWDIHMGEPIDIIDDTLISLVI